MTVQHLTILRHILTMALLVTVDTKETRDTHYRQIKHIMNSLKYSVQYAIADILIKYSFYIYIQRAKFEDNFSQTFQMFRWFH